MMLRHVFNAAFRYTVWEKQSQKESRMNAVEAADVANLTDEWKMNASASREAARLWVSL
jgi:hypothetical protein